MSKPISIHKRRERIKHLGQQLVIRQLSSEDKDFLSEALIQIGNGKDPATALDVKARRGESKGEEARDAESRKELARFVMKGARAEGKTLEEIVSKYGENGLNLFGLTEKTLEQYYYQKDD